MTQPAYLFEPRNDAVRLLEEELSDKSSTSLEEPLSNLDPELWQRALFGPLTDFLGRPGKEFRAHLVRLCWELAGRRQPPPPELPLLVEVLHAGSLIVDDIEDGSAYRRGGPALHVKYGVPIALNAANWLYFWPARLLSRLELPPATELALHRVIGRTLLACHEGQALDVATRVSELDQLHVPRVVRNTTLLKTGKLFELAASIGAIAGGAPSSTVRVLAEFGRELGAGLQMLDDLGGLTSQKRCHKGHEDLIQGRATWPWAWAAERLPRASYQRLLPLSREVVAREVHPEHLAIELVKAVGADAKQRVSQHLKDALNQLSRALEPSRAFDELSREISHLEASYG
ncbi:MAG TPA: polyprenyl synthetase family protein [Polyangiaceae bacterium]|nr:polyprenyl synthetase family protein [Polyangiaceae bacterium]